MKNFAICCNHKIPNSIQVKDKLVKILAIHGAKAEILDIDALKDGFDFVFVIGGDGTILKTARFYAKFQTPIFGINFGRLGFLSQSTEQEIDFAIKKILNNEYVLQDRIMLKCGNYTALNDFVIKSCDTGRTSKFSLKINDKFICDYLADGIIISTPTGSTAYGLSAGGPVLNPSLNAFVIVPICPHTLTARPIVVPDSEKIAVCTDGKSILSTDGQEFYEFEGCVCLEKSQYSAKLALIDDNDFYSILKNKLNWATSPTYMEHAKF
jgi:NAD+ kinase